jgi:ABC-type amino acid transport substrate-binding protein
VGKRFTGVLTLALMAATILIGCSSAKTGDPAPKPDASQAPTNVQPAAPAAGPDRLEEIKKRGTIRIGSTLQFKPQMYKDEKGEPQGYQVEIMRMIAKDLEVKIEIVDMEFPGLIPALLADKVDLVIVGLVPRPSRLLAMEFSDPIIPYSMFVVVPKDSTVTSIQELNQQGKRITALEGSSAENSAKRMFPLATVVGMKQQEALLETASKRADAVVVEDAVVKPFLAVNTAVRLLSDKPVQTEWGAIAIKPGDQRLLNFLNSWVRYYKERGDLDRMYQEIVVSTWK